MEELKVIKTKSIEFKQIHYGDGYNRMYITFNRAPESDTEIIHALDAAGLPAEPYNPKDKWKDVPWYQDYTDCKPTNDPCMFEYTRWRRYTD